MSSTTNTRSRKPRVVYSKDEVRYLKEYFSLCPNPDKKHQVDIASYLNKSTSEICTWFKNQRTYVKMKESREQPTTSIQVPPAIDVLNQENFMYPVNESSNSSNSYQQVLPSFNNAFVMNKRARKARFTFTQHQKNELEIEFAACKHPDHPAKKEIAERLKIDREVVSDWFKNRRTKAKKEAGKENSAPPSSPPQPTTIMELPTFYQYQLLDQPTMPLEVTPSPPPPQPTTILESQIFYQYQMLDEPSMSLEAPMETEPIQQMFNLSDIWHNTFEDLGLV